MDKKILALIDADGLCFQSSRNTLEESILVLNEKINNIYLKTKCTHAAFFISKGKYFRHDIDNKYKSKRGESPLKYLKTLKAYLQEEYKANSMELVEADDLVAYWENKAVFDVSDCPSLWGGITKVVCSTDKDLLQSIQGIHFNYTYKLEDKNNPNSLVKGSWFDNSEVKPYQEYFLWHQMLTGDAADSINCLYGIGQITANKLIKDAVEGDKYLPEYVLSKYISHYRDVSIGIYEFQKNYRLLHLLNCDEDFMREIGKLPPMPNIIEVKTNNDEFDNDIFKI